MKFVALVSGGKDSMFNILHSIANGHELEALANLHPPVASSDEMDSFMYQTVGYHAVSLYDQCLGVPMYRTEIVGSSVVQTLHYAASSEVDDGDETEDLYRLLRTVRKSHDIEAVSVGAILSSFQRNRVESVCQRLGLTCLSYLWDRSQADLLDEIIDSGMDARIIKTAGAGLNKSHLGKSLAQVRDELVGLNQKFGLHLCGEGGEYETLVLDAPNMRKRLLLDLENTKIVEDGDECVSYLCNLAVTMQEKSVNESRVKQPPLLEDDFEELYEELKKVQLGESQPALEPCSYDIPPKLSTVECADRVFIANIAAPTQSSLDDEAHHVFKQLGKELERYSLHNGHVLSISLQVSDMSVFQQVNKIYEQYFSKPGPPSRMCIQTNLANRLQLSAWATKDLTTRVATHVQSWSYWAPANIGPYSQFVQSQELTTVAGQIGLIPASSVLEQDIYKQAALAFQNMHRLLVTAESDRFACAVAFVTNTGLVPLAAKAWQSQAAAPFFIAVVRGLPRGAQVELTGQAVNNVFLKTMPDIDDDDDDDDDLDDFEWVSPPKPTKDGVKYGRYATAAVVGSVDEIETKVAPLQVVGATMYAKAPPPEVSFCCEVIHVDALYDKQGNEIDLGVFVHYKL